MDPHTGVSAGRINNRSSNSSPLRDALRGDSGVGMVEVAVAMIILGVLVIAAFLPLIVSSIELAAKNTVIAQANQLLSSELDAQRISMSGKPCESTNSADDIEAFSVTRVVSCDGALATLSIDVKSLEYDGETFASATTRVATD